MNKDQKHIDQQIRDRLLQHEVKPPKSSWEAIEATLEKDRKPNYMLFVKYALAAAIVGVFVWIGALQLNKPPVEELNSPTIALDTIQIETIEVEEDSLEQIKNDQIRIKETSIDPIHENTFAEVEPLIIEEDNKKANVKLDILSPMQSIYQTSVIALNRLIFDIPKKEKEATAEELYRDYLAYYENAFKEEPKKDRNMALRIGYGAAANITGSGDMAYSGGISDEMINRLNNSDNPEEQLQAISFGLNLNYDIGKRLTLQTGVAYHKRAQVIQNLNMFTFSDGVYSSVNNGVWSENVEANTNNGNVVIDAVERLTENSNLLLGDAEVAGISGTLYEFDLHQNFEYIELPIILGYRLIDSRFKLSIQGGLNTGILIGNKVSLGNSASQKLGFTENMNTFVYKGVLGFSVDYPVFKKIHLFFSPSFNYQFNKYNSQTHRFSNRKSIDFKTGISYWF